MLFTIATFESLQQQIQVRTSVRPQVRDVDRESFNTVVVVLYKLSFIVIKPSEASEGLQNETIHEDKYRLVRSDGGPPHASQAFCSL